MVEVENGRFRRSIVFMIAIVMVGKHCYENTCLSLDLSCIDKNIIVSALLLLRIVLYIHTTE
jgi:hypothetical protein